MKADGSVAVHPDVELTHLKLEQDFEGSVTLDGTVGEVVSIFGGTGKMHEPDPEPLSNIVALLNERFGTNWDPQDRLPLFETVAGRMTRDETVQRQAFANSPENFGLIAKKQFESGVIDQIGVFEETALAFLDDAEFRDAAYSYYLPLIQVKAKVAHQEHCDVVDLLGPDRESSFLEFKATLRTHEDSGETFKPLETATLKTIVAFMNGHEGSTLLIGVSDNGATHGLDSNYASRSKQTQDARDWFQQHLSNIISTSMGDAAATNLRAQMLHVDGRDICRFQVDPSGFPVDAKVIKQKPGGPKEKLTEFYVRHLNGTKALDAVEKQKYINQRWSTSTEG